MTIKKAEGQTLLTLFRLVIVSIALLGSWGMQAVADAAFDFAHNSRAMIDSFLNSGDGAALPSPVEGRLYVLYYAEHDPEDQATRHVYKHYYITGKENSLGLKDSAGKVLLPEQYQDIRILPAAYLLKEGGQWRFYDRELSPLTEDAWDGVELELAENGRISSPLIRVEKGGFFGAADMLGQVLVQPVYEELELYTFAADWPISRVRYEGRYGYIDSEGQTVIDLVYDYAIMSSYTVYPEAPAGEDPVGEEQPIVYVVKDGDWGGITKRVDGSPNPVDWAVEPDTQVLQDYNASAAAV